ncbi:MAG: hypothetical protein LBM77_03410 [Spirochaetaceae bacterium]|jgi:hypothetical protein|nr:hypothetical protein [Spirochaetaceae bacterium]
MKKYVYLVLMALAAGIFAYAEEIPPAKLTVLSGSDNYTVIQSWDNRPFVLCSLNDSFIAYNEKMELVYESKVPGQIKEISSFSYLSETYIVINYLDNETQSDDFFFLKLDYNSNFLELSQYKSAQHIQKYYPYIEDDDESVGLYYITNGNLYQNDEKINTDSEYVIDISPDAYIVKDGFLEKKIPCDIAPRTQYFMNEKEMTYFINNIKYAITTDDAVVTLYRIEEDYED